MNKNVIQRNGVHPHYSRSVCYNGVAYLSGRVSFVGGDITEQCTEVFGHVDRELKLVGSSWYRILNMQIFLHDPADYVAMNAVWDKCVPDGAAPVRTTICGVQFPNPAWLIEVVVTAAIPSS